MIEKRYFLLTNSMFWWIGPKVRIINNYELLKGMMQ